MVRGGSANSLAPGFRFHPTDEELVRYYLKRKVTSKPFRFDHIAVIDIYKFEPWDLPDKSRLKSRDLEWYFFSSLDKKYGNGSKTNRATDRGYWKTTGKDRPIQFDSRTVGLKKTLVYHQGRAPRGERSNWVMHEYRLVDEELAKTGVAQDSFVLCRVFQKSGTGPKNGEQHGAPFVEEEWDDDEEVAPLPGDTMVAADEITVGDNEYVEINDLEQNFNFGAESENVGWPLNFYHGETSNYKRTANLDGNYEKPMVVRHENQFIPDLPNGQNMANVIEQPKTDINTVEEKHVAEASNNANADFNYLIDEPYFDATSDLPFEAKDLWNTLEAESARDSTGIDMLEEYLSFFDADDDNFSFDPSELLGGDNNLAEHITSPQKDVNGENVDMPMASQIPLVAHGNGGNEASSSNSKPEVKPSSDSGIKNQLLKKASQMLGNIPAPPAFASEFPPKDATLRISSAHPSGSIHVAAGMMRVESFLPTTNSFDWSVGKNRTINITLSFSLSQGRVSSGDSAPIANLFSGKMGPMVRRSWFSIMLLGVLILSVSSKVGTYIYAK